MDEARGTTYGSEVALFGTDTTQNPNSIKAIERRQMILKVDYHFEYYFVLSMTIK